MPNIFGKTPRDYSFLNEQRGDMTDAQFMDALERSGSQRSIWDHDFSRRNFTSRQDADTAGFGLISNNSEALQTEIEEILRRKFVLPTFVPINTSVPEGAKTFGFKVIDRYGKGRFINHDGSNVEGATASISKMVFGVEYAGVQPEWNLQDLREVLYTGVSLDGETLIAGAEACMNHIQDIGFSGDSDVGFKGFLNQATVPVYGGTVPVFSTATALEISAFINALIMSIGQTTNELIYQHFGDNELVIVLPTIAYDAIATRPLGTDANKTVMEWLKRYNLWTSRTGKSVRFESLPEAKGASATPDDGRVAVYPFTNRVLEMAIPIMPRIIKILDTGYSAKAPMEYSMSGVNVKRDKMMLYADGVLV